MHFYRDMIRTSAKTPISPTSSVQVERTVNFRKISSNKKLAFIEVRTTITSKYLGGLITRTKTNVTRDVKEVYVNY